MDPTARFFTALRKMAVTFESETEKLQQAFKNRDNDDDGDSDATAKATRAFHEVNCDVGVLKGQLQGQIAQQRAQGNEVTGFIEACRVMEQRVTKDIQTLKGHWEKYGYQAPRETQRPTNTEAKDEASEAEDEAANESETKSSRGGGGENQEEDGGRPSSPPPGPPPFADMLRTPQLSDFGLSEVAMKRALAGVGWCSEVSPMPKLSLPPPSLNTPTPLTPKCTLRMDDDELQTHQMSDFGISEHTMCLNNDFTMDLFRKNNEKPQRPPLVPPVKVEGLHTKAQNLVSPEPPVFYTPRFKIKKTNHHRSPPAQSNGDPESPVRPENLPTTPEAPVFQTPYMNRMATSRKSARQPESINMDVDADDHDDADDLQSPRNMASSSKRLWGYDVPDISVTGVEDGQMPEMPILESVLGNSLQTRSAKMQKTVGHKKVTNESTVPNLELDGPTQEFSFGTPRLRMDYQEPSIPEMADLSCVTQDICKLLTKAPLKRTATVHPNVRPENDKIRALRLSEVSESEFQSLPQYLKQMTLHSLNQAVHNINKFIEESRGEQTEFRMEALKRMCVAGIKTPVYILCLTELKRLQHAGGARSTAVYKLCTHN